MEFKCKLSTKQFHQLDIIQYLMDGCTSFGYHAKTKKYWGIKMDEFMFQMWLENGIIYLDNIIYFKKQNTDTLRSQFQELIEYINESV